MKPIAAIGAVMIALTSCARQIATAPAPGGVDDFVLNRGVVYGRAPSDAGDTVELLMDVASPERAHEVPLPAVVYVHGGRWRTGSREDGLRYTELFARGGYVAATIDYRLAEVAKAPAAVDDVKAALRYLRENAKALGVDPQRMGLWGHAAGGHLSALAGTSGAAVRCAASVSAPTDLAAGVFGPEGDAIIAYWLGAGSVAAAPDAARALSPITHVDPADPPFLVVHGTADERVPFSQADRFAAALREAGVECELFPVEGAGHAIDDEGVTRRIAAFFDAHLGGRAAPVVGVMMPTRGDEN